VILSSSTASLASGDPFASPLRRRVTHTRGGP
jgi:hypothetical protein